MQGAKELNQAREFPKDIFFNTLKSSIVEIDNNKLKPNKNNEKPLEQRVAEDYLSRISEVRDQTVVIVHSNHDRRVIANIIRNGLKSQGEIDKNGIKTSCLIPKSSTDAEHRLLGSYNIGDVVKIGKEYYQVEEKEPATRSILLKNEAGKIRYFYPEKQADKYNIELYEHTKEELAVGDIIRLTKTDKERERYANFEYKVEAADHSSVTLRGKEDKNTQLILRPKELKDAHWDYAQTVTGYGIQGGSKTYAIDFEVSYRKNLTNQRSFYIGASRAIQHLIIYTDNKKKLLDRVLANKGDKYSALEIVGDVNQTNNNNRNNKNKKQNKYVEQGIHTIRSNKQITTPEQIAHKMHPLSSYTDSIGHKTLNDFYGRDFKEIENTINTSAEVLIERLLGQPNQKLSTAAEWRYGNKGSLAIRMAGDKKGLWHNFETGESGNLISLIKKETGLSFKETLKYAANISGITKLYNEKNQQTISTTKERNSATGNTKDLKTKNYAITLAKESQSINGTIVEKYLKEIRGIKSIKNINSTDIRYHPKVYIGKNENQKYFPAMLSIGRNKDGNIKCVQATYLDPKTANKANIDIKKRTYASPSEAAVLLQKSSSKNKISYITEGVETGLSVKDAIKRGEVFATLGKSNFMTLDPAKLGQRVIFCLDNDGKNIYNDEIIYKATTRLINLGKEVFISIPMQINNQKTDFNDVARTSGAKAVRYCLDNIKSYDKSNKQEAASKNLHTNDILQKATKSKSENKIAGLDHGKVINFRRQKELSLNDKQFELTK